MPKRETMTKVKLNRKPKIAGNGTTYYNQFGMKSSEYKRRYNTFSPNIILPCDPIALVVRLDILMSSTAAGNTEVRTNWYQFAMN